MAANGHSKPKPRRKRAKDGSRRGGARPNSGPKKGSKRRIPRVEDFAELGDAPEDELERLRWISAALGVRARQVMLDKQMPDDKRGAELRSLARAMNALTTKNRLRQAEILVRGEAADMKRRAADPPVGPRPKPEEPDGA
jgi:hypothetical protein